MIAPDVGGGFGQKMSLAGEFVVLVMLARKLRTSVAWMEDRRENLIACFHSRDQHVTLEGAFDADGKLIALSADVLANVGAYSCFPTTCGVEPLMAMAEMPGPYDVREYACVSRGVRYPYLSDGAVSRRVATGHHLRARAPDGQGGGRSFGLDPIEIRRRNLVAAFPTRPRPGSCSTKRPIWRPWTSRCAPSMCRRFVCARRGARANGRYPRHRLRDVLRAHRLRHARLCRARHGDHAGLGDGGPRHGSVGLRRGPHRRFAARPGAAHHARADRRRRARRPAATRQGHPRRHRPHALRLGHVRQPLAGRSPAAPR